MAETALQEGRGVIAAVETVPQFTPTANVMAMGEKSMWQYVCRVIDVGTWMKRCGMAGSKDLGSQRVNPPPGTNPKASSVDMIPAKRNTSCSVSSKSQKRYIKERLVYSAFRDEGEMFHVGFNIYFRDTRPGARHRCAGLRHL
ncbi:hypothetical protein ACLOJK_037313, partial [Asimina triloba]